MNPFAAAREQRLAVRGGEPMLDEEICRATATISTTAEEDDSRAGDQSAVYDENGVDRSLVRWMLSLTPAERLTFAESMRDVSERARRDTIP